MYRCDKCDKLFLRPRVTEENVGFTENPHWEYEETSPCCHYSFEEVDDVTVPDEQLQQMKADALYQQEMEEAMAMAAWYGMR